MTEGNGVFHRDHNTGGLFIQAVNDSWPDNPVNLREILAVKEEGIYQGARVNPCSWMDNHARGLIDDNDPWILVEDIQGDILGDYVQSPGWRDTSGDQIPLPQSHGRF